LGSVEEGKEWGVKSGQELNRIESVKSVKTVYMTKTPVEGNGAV
jgi:glycine cleavage system H lipoate-binding protein